MVAMPKLQCIAADAELRSTLRARLKDSGFRVTKLGEMLGTDFSAGGPLTRRRAQDQRRRKAKSRRSRLRWWAAAGGDAQHVIRTGDEPSVAYGSHTIGLTPPALRDMRRSHGAFARVKCGGASLAAKLATAGPAYADIDPAVTYAAPSFVAVASMIWDLPRTRHHYIFAWRRAVRDIADTGAAQWDLINGPVSAAMCHLLRIGVRWVGPFAITWDINTINILDTSLLHVQALLRDRARVICDREMLQRLGGRRGWNKEQVDDRYRHGIDWECLRAHLRTLKPVARKALQVAAAGGYWSDERRWLQGYAQSPECTSCNQAVGDDIHYSSWECGAVGAMLTWGKNRGQ